MLSPARLSDSLHRPLSALTLVCCLLLSSYLVTSWVMPDLWPRTGQERPVVAPNGSATAPAPGAIDQLASGEAVLPSESVTGPSATDVAAQPPTPPAPVTSTALSRPLVVRPREIVTAPILMYHYVDDLPRTLNDPYRRDLTVSILSFRKQLEFFESSYAQTISLDDLMRHLKLGEPLPHRAVVLSFDDGYEDNYRIAYPLLRQYGMKATFFIVANLVGKQGYMTWDQLREMQQHGMSIESHSLDHVDLAIQPLAELQRQLVDSRRLLEQQLGRPIRFLAYPSGRYNDRVIAEVRAAGYEAAVTTNYGLRQTRAGLYELNRVRVKGADTIDTLASKLVPPSWRATFGPFGR